MAKLADLEPLDEFDPKTAQVLLGDNPTFRANQRELVELVKQRITEKGNAEMIAALPKLDDALAAYMVDPVWVGGRGHVGLNETLRPFLEVLGIRAGNFGLL